MAVTDTRLPDAYRPASPPDDSLVAWRAGFGTRFMVWVDTEEEFDWSQPFRRECRDTSAMAALPAAHARFAARGVPVTYLIDHPIATDPHSVAILNELVATGDAAIGTQLHPWVNPPFDEAITHANSFAGNLPRDLEAAKIRLLTQTIEAAFGARPIAYRAGRYGIGPNSFAILAAEGYLIDTSMRACFDYSGEGGPDFSGIGNRAFRCGPERRLIEVPLTTVFLGGARRMGAGLYPELGRVPRGRGAFARLGLLSRISLTPEEMPIEAALRAVRCAVADGLRLLNFSFHSPSLAPGHTPYVRDAADLACFHQWWDRMLDELDQLGVRPAGLETILAAAS